MGQGAYSSKFQQGSGTQHSTANPLGIKEHSTVNPRETKAHSTVDLEMLVKQEFARICIRQALENRDARAKEHTAASSGKVKGHSTAQQILQESKSTAQQIHEEQKSTAQLI